MNKIKIVIHLIVFVATCGCIAAQPPPVEVNPGENMISEAMMFAYPGDILELTEGEYTETQTLVVTMDITIRGTEGATVIWNVPTELEQAIHVKGNFRLENIIFKTDTDTLPNRKEMAQVECIMNMYGGVERGQEINADKNNIFVDHCQFIGFKRAIAIPLSNETDPQYDTESPDGKCHPVDTLCVTNCLFYGGGKYKSFRGITVKYGQARVVKVKYCTFWNSSSEGIKAEGHEIQLDYMKILVDHCTFHQNGLPPLAMLPGNGIYVKYTSADDTLRNCVFGNISAFGIKAQGGKFLEMFVDYHVAAPEIGWLPGCGVCQPYHYNLTNTGSHCLISDPKFVDGDNGDFRYQSGSLALTAADDRGPVGNQTQVYNPGTWGHTPLSNVVDNKGYKLPVAFALRQNYPNPFNPETTISYSVPRFDLVTLEIYNAVGKKVRSLISEVKAVGSYSAVWKGVDDHGQCVPSSVYLYRLKFGEMVETKKMLLMK